MNLGVLGGTFDPVHMGHLVLAECARDQLSLDRVIFVPAGDPWRKALRAITPALHRVEMVRLAVAGNEAFALDDREVRRSGPSYTSETLRELSASFSRGEVLYFLLGEDALADLPNWRDPAAIVREARLAIAPRKDSPPVESPLLAGARVDRLDMPYIGISSTDIRQRVHERRSVRYLVPEAVEAYIRKQKLYC